MIHSIRRIIDWCRIYQRKNYLIEFLNHNEIPHPFVEWIIFDDDDDHRKMSEIYGKSHLLKAEYFVRNWNMRPLNAFIYCFDMDSSLQGRKPWHDDVIQWTHFPHYWPFVRGIHLLPVNSPHKGQWRGALMFSFHLCLNTGLGKQSWGWWFETPSRPLWRHSNDKLSRVGTEKRHSFDMTSLSWSIGNPVIKIRRSWESLYR